MTAVLTPQFCELGKAVIQVERDAIAALEHRIDHSFRTACEIILKCKGRVVVIGMGKSGHIGNKIASTLASTGTPAFSVHPGEASHGDMGMITSSDVVIAISNSGETPEIIKLLPVIKRLGVPLITLTGRVESTLSKAAEINLDVSVKSEACPLGLAPTASTTATLVMGDALAIALLEVRGFTADDFALFHPGGTLGRRLLLRVEDVMYTHENIPHVLPDCPLDKALIEVTRKRLGMTTVLDPHGKLLGIFTDGDLRRALDQGIDVHKTLIKDVMTSHCKTIPPKTLAASALKIMQDNKITTLVITDTTKTALGVVHMHELLREGVV